jgi:tetratricopeptide (TPR) repeat protein
MAITGRLEKISLPEVLQLLALGRRSGRLTMQSGASTGTIRFRMGSVVHASVQPRSDAQPGHANGAGADDRVQSGAGSNGDRFRPRSAEQSRDALRDSLRRQIEESVCVLFAWSEGTFQFEPAAVEEAEAPLIHLSAEGLLLEAARRSDEQDREESAIPPTSSPCPLELTRPDLEAGEFGAALDAIMRAMEGGKISASSFHSLGLALEGLGRCDDALLAVAEGLRISPHDPALLLSEAILLFKLGRVDEAVPAFRVYEEEIWRDADHPEAFYVFSTLALAMDGRLEEAADRADLGISIFPDCAPLLLHAAVVKERMGDPVGAATLYHRALGAQPALPQVERGLAELPSRRARP